MRKQFVLSILFIFLITGQQNFVSGQQTKKQTISNAFIKTETDRIFNKLVEVRRRFHENPELAGKEKQTQETIKRYLLKLGLEVKTGIYGYGVVGILKGGKKGKGIAWRADMDALPNNFPDKVAFKSHIKGVQHGCGHDVHMAIALGIAEVLSKNRKNLKGTAYFIFQPEEETFIGAKSMIDSGLLSKINVDEIYALHVTALPAGQIMVKPDEVFAYQKRIRIQLKNVLPGEKINELAKSIRQLLSRTSSGGKPWEIQQMTDHEMGLMNPNTIFKDYLIIDEHFDSYSKNDAFFLEAYLYETDSSNLEKIIPSIKHLIDTGEYKDGLIAVSFIQQNPTINNDKGLTAIAVKTIDKIYGKGFIVKDYGQVPYFNDDFTYFQQKIPGVYFFLGGSDIAKGMIAMNHAPDFEVDEECIRTAVSTFSNLIFERLKN